MLDSVLPANFDGTAVFFGKAAEGLLKRQLALQEGADENAQAIGMKPLLSGASPEDEGLYVLHHKHWVSEMLRAIDKERSQFIATVGANEEASA